MEATPQLRNPLLTPALTNKGVFLQPGACTEPRIQMTSEVLPPDSLLLGLQRHLANWKH